MKTPYSKKSKISIELASVRKENQRIHTIIPIEKKSIFFVIFGIFFISLIFTQPAFAIEPECEWELRENDSVRAAQISYNENEKTFTNIQNSQSRLVELDCTLSEAISLQDKLIDFEFIIKSPRTFEMALSLLDISGDRIFTSSQIMNWYDISQDKRAHVVLDPGDFGINTSLFRIELRV